MPTVLTVKTTNSPGADQNVAYTRGMLIGAYPQNYQFGYAEMPVNPIGQFSVQQINNLAAEPAIYSAIKVTDSGVVTKGAADITVVAGDVIVWLASFLPDGSIDPTGWHFVNYGDQKIPDDPRYHIRITDREVDDVRIYLETFGKKVTYESLQYNPANDLRRVRVTNLSVTASGNNGFTDEGTLAVAQEWNGTRVSWSPTEFVLDAVLPLSAYDEFRRSTELLAYDDLYRRRQWYITEQGMTALDNNNGLLSGPVSTVSQYLRNGIDD